MIISYLILFKINQMKVSSKKMFILSLSGSSTTIGLNRWLSDNQNELV